MEENAVQNGTDSTNAAPEQTELRGGTYEILRSRLTNHGKELRSRLGKLNEARKQVFGAVESKLLSSERISTDNNCVPRDMVPIGDKFIFGYNVFVGLRAETVLEDVFAIYQWKDGTFTSRPLDLIRNAEFEADFKNLYRYYRKTVFAKFSVIGPHLFMVFRVGRDVADIKTFKWLIRGGALEYQGNRSDHEFIFPPQHEFEWQRVTQDMFRQGKNPHISIQDRVFVETIGGDLTIKIEDNTETGEGIYAEPVDNPDQMLSDAEIRYAIVGSLIVLKIRPYEEQQFRYFVYNEKIQKAIRLDAIEQACILLPEDHGFVFPKGYYLKTGELKQFETQMDDMVFEKRLDSPNGEDCLYVFHNRDSGVYVLLSYNIIEQKISTPVVCNGYSFFEDGTLIYFRANDEPKKHHAIQVWQTPYYGPDFVIPVKTDSQLYKIGNKDIVRCMAECTEIITLLGQEETYVNLYLDLARKAEEVQDAYFWIDSAELFNLAEPLGAIRDAARAAVDEYEKVVRTKENTRAQIAEVTQQVREIVTAIDYSGLNEIHEYVEHLAQLRSIRGQVISLRDLRYADTEMIASLETEVAEHTDKLSRQCVEFLLKPESLDPYRAKAEGFGRQVPELGKVADARQLQEQVAETASSLEMLTEIVSNLKIEDATQTIAIIDNISLVYAEVNQVKSALKNKLNEIGKIEGQAEFSSQLKLIDQSVVNYLDVCDTPDKCDEYLTKAMVQIENLESRFADFEEFVVQLADKREELYDAFNSRKVQLVAARNQRASALMASAERILKGIENRVRNLTDINEINGYFASDLMIDRIRQTIEQLKQLGDTVKAQDAESRLKTIHQDAVRQLKDRQALYEEGENVIRLGNQKFAVNRQALEGTIVRKEGRLFFHLTGTGFFEAIEDELLEQTKDVWDLDVLSESPGVYRAEYLAFKMLENLRAGSLVGATPRGRPGQAQRPDPTLSDVQAFMSPRYNEGYVKGVHDRDAAAILEALLQLESAIGLLRYGTAARALATVFWHARRDDHDALAARITGMGRVNRLFGPSPAQAGYVTEIETRLMTFVKETQLFDPGLVSEAAEYLFHQLSSEGGFVVSQVAVGLKEGFERHLEQSHFGEEFAQSRHALVGDPLSCFRLVRDWVRSYLRGADGQDRDEYADEVATLLLPELAEGREVVTASVEQELTGLVGSHPLIEQGNYRLNYCHFMARLRHHEQCIVPKFTRYQAARNAHVECYSKQLHLEEFQPHVLTTFVRNRLIDKIYLPLIGQNLAKQIGAEGESKRTDRQGLLLLISPPGYGKTTLMEYVANRLGLTFVKVNGPAVGNRVTSLDPNEAPNAAARQQLKKLNLAFEMGDNVMIYVDDIQHTSPEFLQKFISLCDAQRRIEGVYRDQTRTYDLRGKRVCVVMAGNPYTESGQRFRIPDMLANRADTYNIGDIVGDNYDQFALSYIENCLTSNPVLETLTRRSQNDAYAVMKMAETDQQEGIDFEGNYTVEEIHEYVATMKKLLTVRDVVLRVNQEYIRSAGQAKEYRTEPPFLLQGSYRNMNRIAARVLPIMNDQELWTLIHSAYEQDAQTLTTGAENNLLKFRELTGRLTDEQAARWAEIKRTFQRNVLLGDDTEDKVGKMIRQLNAFSAGLDSIKDVLAQGVTTMAQSRAAEPALRETDTFKTAADDILAKMGQLIAEIKQQRTVESVRETAQRAEQTKSDSRTLVSVLEEQFKAMETWLLPMSHGDKDERDRVIDQLAERFETMVRGYTKLIDVLKSKRVGADAPPKKTTRKPRSGE
ncbi:MAG: DNA repair ATPase [Sedimentisphaerales bacterium]|nr:DNA repair ATPase [Sedimentisphaerales bacterium]